jgi:hypothetical protein
MGMLTTANSRLRREGDFCLEREFQAEREHDSHLISISKDDKT